MARAFFPTHTSSFAARILLQEVTPRTSDNNAGPRRAVRWLILSSKSPSSSLFAPYNLELLYTFARVPFSNVNGTFGINGNEVSVSKFTQLMTRTTETR